MIVEDVARYLASKGIGKFSSGSGCTIFLNKMPATPNNCLMVRQGGANAGDGTPHQYVAIQVLTRGDMRGAAEKAEAVSEALSYFSGALGGQNVVIVEP